MSIRIYAVFLLFCVSVAAFRRADPLSKESYWLCTCRFKKLKSGQGPTTGCRTIDRYISVIRNSLFLNIEFQGASTLSNNYQLRHMPYLKYFLPSSNLPTNFDADLVIWLILDVFVQNLHWILSIFTAITMKSLSSGMWGHIVWKMFTDVLPTSWGPKNKPS
jgi:hypothetical protein